MGHGARSGRALGVRYHHGDLKPALVAAGRAILEEKGPRGLSLREAARRAGVSHAAPAHHFATLGAFLADCAAAGFDELRQALDDARAAADAVDPTAGLCAMGRAYVRFARANSAVFRLMFDRGTYTAPTASFRHSAERAYAGLVAAVGARGRDELEFEVAAVWAIVHGHSILMLEERICLPAGEVAMDEQVTRALRAFLLGSGQST